MGTKDISKNAYLASAMEGARVGARMEIKRIMTDLESALALLKNKPGHDTSILALEEKLRQAHELLNAIDEFGVSIDTTPERYME